MTSTEVQPDGQKSTLAIWRTRIIGALAFIAVLFVSYFILAAFIPRWWAQRLGELISGSFAKGIGWGLVIGGLCTAIPLFLLLFASRVWRRRGGKVMAGAAGVLAVIAAIPNLMTLGIVLGDGNAARAGRTILDVDGPAFRGATLAGAIAAGVLFLLAVLVLVRRWWRRRHPAKPATPPPAPTPGAAATRPDAL